MNVLFVCHDNSALSLMAESILHSLGNARFSAFSAGCVPGNCATPEVIEFLAQHRMRTSGLQPKALDSFRMPGAPRLDFIITLCESAASEDYRDWPGAPFVAHWNVMDDGDEAPGDAAQRQAFWSLWRRINVFANLPRGSFNRRALERRALTLQPGYL